MDNIDIVILLLFFIISSYVSKREFKVYEEFIKNWKSTEKDTYEKYGSPDESNISFSSLRIKYGLLFNFDYKRVLSNQELKEKACLAQKYFYIQHVLIVAFVFMSVSWK